jgi:hypothetical protein
MGYVTCNGTLPLVNCHLSKGSPTAMDSSIRALVGWFSKSNWPSLGCPKCGIGQLLLQEGELRADKVSADIANWTEWGDPTDIGGVFVARLQCSRDSCGEVVAVSGDFSTDHDYEPGQPDPSYIEVYRVRTLHPAIPLFLAPEGTPESVRTDLHRAAATIWLDPPSAITCLRRSLESLLTEHGVPAVSAGKITSRLTLHQRLEEFKKVRPDVADLLEAVKWVGNDATHEGGQIAAEDAVDIAEFVEVALGMLYVKDNSSILRHAKAIVQAKKLVPKPR